MSVYKDFTFYASYGYLPYYSIGLFRENSFYKSVRYINSVVSPIQDAISSLLKSVIALSFTIVLTPLCLAFAYLSYLPAKLLTKIFDLKSPDDISASLTESLVEYSSIVRSKAYEYTGYKLGRFVSTVFNYACAAIIWTAALVITPLVWAVDKIIDKVQSKFSDVEEPEAHHSRYDIHAST